MALDSSLNLSNNNHPNHVELDPDEEAEYDLNYSTLDLTPYVDRVHRAILGQCYREATNSPDTSTQLGAVIVTARGVVKYPTLSHNGFTEGWMIEDADLERPRKYSLIEHAERRAIYRAAKYGIPLEGCSLYSSWAACADCARAIVESGITELVRHYPPQDEATDRWLESVVLGDEIMTAGGVVLTNIHGPIKEGFPILRGGELFDPSL